MDWKNNRKILRKTEIPKKEEKYSIGMECRQKKMEIDKCENHRVIVITSTDTVEMVGYPFIPKLFRNSFPNWNDHKYTTNNIFNFDMEIDGSITARVTHKLMPNNFRMKHNMIGRCQTISTGISKKYNFDVNENGIAQIRFK